MNQTRNYYSDSLYESDRVRGSDSSGSSSVNVTQIILYGIGALILIYVINKIFF